MALASAVRLASGVALRPASIFDILHPRFLLPGSILSLEMKFGHLRISLHKLGDPVATRLGGGGSRVNKGLESALVLGSLILHLLCGLVSYGLLHLLELF